MNLYETVIRKTLEIEEILIKKFGAYGKTFGDKVSSIEHTLSPDLLEKLWILVKERNKAVHKLDSGVDKKRFTSLASEIISELNGDKKTFNPKTAISLGILSVISAGFAVYKLIRNSSYDKNEIKVRPTDQ